MDSPAHQRLDHIVGRFIVEHIGPLANINTIAYENVKNTWTRRGIWNVICDMLPVSDVYSVSRVSPLFLANSSVLAFNTASTFRLGKRTYDDYLLNTANNLSDGYQQIAWDMLKNDSAIDEVILFDDAHNMSSYATNELTISPGVALSDKLKGLEASFHHYRKAQMQTTDVLDPPGAGSTSRLRRWLQARHARGSSISSFVTTSSVSLTQLLGPLLPDLRRLTIPATTPLHLPEDSSLLDLTLLNSRVCGPHRRAIGMAREVPRLENLERLCIEVAPSLERWGLSHGRNTSEFIDLSGCCSLQEVTLITRNGFATPSIFRGPAYSLQRLRLLGAFGWHSWSEWRSFWIRLAPRRELHSLNMEGSFLGNQDVAGEHPDLDKHHREVFNSQSRWAPTLDLNCLELVLVDPRIWVDLIGSGRWNGMRKVLIESDILIDVGRLLRDLATHCSQVKTVSISIPEDLLKDPIEPPGGHVEAADGRKLQATVMFSSDVRWLAENAKSLRYLELVGPCYFLTHAWTLMDTLVFPTLDIFHLEHPDLSPRSSFVRKDHTYLNIDFHSDSRTQIPKNMHRLHQGRIFVSSGCLDKWPHLTEVAPMRVQKEARRVWFLTQADPVHDFVITHRTPLLAPYLAAREHIEPVMMTQDRPSSAGCNSFGEWLSRRYADPGWFMDLKAASSVLHLSVRTRLDPVVVPVIVWARHHDNKQEIDTELVERFLQDSTVAWPTKDLRFVALESRAGEGDHYIAQVNMSRHRSELVARFVHLLKAAN